RLSEEYSAAVGGKNLFTQPREEGAEFFHPREGL
ncbi:MAG: hypothetical protein RL386_677, partial [Bacteroidota bacterium]